MHTKATTRQYESCGNEGTQGRTRMGDRGKLEKGLEHLAAFNLFYMFLYPLPLA